MNQIIKRTLVIEEPEKLFFISDPHFCHENIIRLCGRPFHNVHEMNETIISNWNDAVSEEDEIVIIGDMFWTEDKLPDYRNIMARLAGRKHLIFGNHDYFSAQQYLDMGFTSAQPYLEVVIGKVRIDCFHYPMLEWNGYYKGTLHFHGHAHGKSSHFSRRVLDVGVDANGFKPIKWADIAGKYGEIIKEELAKIRADKQRTHHRPYNFGAAGR